MLGSGEKTLRDVILASNNERSYKGNRYMLFICRIWALFTIFIWWKCNFLINLYQLMLNVKTEARSNFSGSSNKNRIYLQGDFIDTHNTFQYGGRKHGNTK